MRRLLWTIPVLALAALIGCGSSSSSTNERVPAGSAAMVPIEKEIEASAGKVVLIDFWAMWCQPCVRKFPTIVKFHNRYADKGLTVFTVSLDDLDDSAGVQEFLESRGARFKNILMGQPSREDDKAIRQRFGFRGSIPHMVLLNKKGEKVWDSSTKPVNEAEFAERVDEMIQTELAK